MIYLIGSLRNPEIPKVAARLRAEGHEVFDDWYAAGENADDYWMRYEQAKGHNFKQALAGFSADHVFSFDKKHLERADTVVLLLPAGKSGHLELGWAIGKGKKGYIVYGKEPERFDVMYLFADGVFVEVEELIEFLKKDTKSKLIYVEDELIKGPEPTEEPTIPYSKRGVDRSIVCEYGKKTTDPYVDNVFYRLAKLVVNPTENCLPEDGNYIAECERREAAGEHIPAALALLALDQSTQKNKEEQLTNLPPSPPLRDLVRKQAEIKGEKLGNLHRTEVSSGKSCNCPPLKSCMLCF